jgi:hypothetical protein
MATTRYVVAATANFKAKVMSNLKSAKREADLRAKGDRVDVTVTTQATGRVTYTAEALAPAAPVSEVPAPDMDALITEVQQEAAAAKPAPAADADRTAPCGCKVEAILATGAHGKGCKDAPARKAAAKSVEKDKPVKVAKPRTGGGGRRESLGASAVTGWELLYDKPKQDAQVGRNATTGKYALICTKHQHAHELTRLVQERGLRGGKRSVWCPSC